METGIFPPDNASASLGSNQMLCRHSVSVSQPPRNQRSLASSIVYFIVAYITYIGLSIKSGDGSRRNRSNGNNSRSISSSSSSSCWCSRHYLTSHSSIRFPTVGLFDWQVVGRVRTSGRQVTTPVIRVRRTVWPLRQVRRSVTASKDSSVDRTMTRICHAHVWPIHSEFSSSLYSSSTSTYSTSSYSTSSYSTSSYSTSSYFTSSYSTSSNSTSSNSTYSSFSSSSTTSFN